jgi:hypothetical protein
MNLRTTFPIEPSHDRITYDENVMFIGSCFASYIGSYMKRGHMPVMINPAGTVFNPVSVINTLDIILSGREHTSDDLHYYDNVYHSFYHYSDFSSGDPEKILGKMNKRREEGMKFIKEARFLFITFGTARVYRFKETGLIVSNCHKMPHSFFNPQLLSVDDIVIQWNNMLNRLYSYNPGLKIIFTISPVRHWKDGVHGNQVSKSVLFLAVEELLKHRSSPQYFPAYELIMDDLRDYRFYADDMLHPSNSAINYIWETFCSTYMEKETLDLWQEVARITRACHHRPSGEKSRITGFARGMLERISAIRKKAPFVDLTAEQDYFNSFLEP